MTLALAACSNDDEQSNVTNDNEIRIDAIHPSQVTRLNSTGFDSGDEIGVFVVADGAELQPYGNSVNNGKFTYDGSKWNAAHTYYWNEGKHNVYAYYPYCDAVTDTDEYLFKVNTDQSIVAGYSESDFLWAKTEGAQAGAQAVTLKFDHILSKAVVELVKGDDYEGEFPDDIEVYLHNTITTAAIDLSTGSSVKDGYSSAETIQMQKLSKSQYTAIVVPQRIDSRRPIVEVVMGNVSYLMEGTMSFKQGYQHTITITIASNPQQAEIEIGGGIGTWD